MILLSDQAAETFVKDLGALLGQSDKRKLFSAKKLFLALTVAFFLKVLIRKHKFKLFSY